MQESRLLRQLSALHASVDHPLAYSTIPFSNRLQQKLPLLTKNTFSSTKHIYMPHNPDNVSTINIFLQGWMNEMYFYDPEIYHPSVTHSVFVTLEDSSLKLSYPKNNIPRRATFEEEIAEPTFVNHRHYDMSGTKVRPGWVGVASVEMLARHLSLSVIPSSHIDLMDKAEADPLNATLSSLKI